MIQRVYIVIARHCPKLVSVTNSANGLMNITPVQLHTVVTSRPYVEYTQ